MGFPSFVRNNQGRRGPCDVQGSLSAKGPQSINLPRQSGTRAKVSNLTVMENWKILEGWWSLKVCTEKSLRVFIFVQSCGHWFRPSPGQTTPKDRGKRVRMIVVSIRYPEPSARGKFPVCNSSKMFKESTLTLVLSGDMVHGVTSDGDWLTLALFGRLDQTGFGSVMFFQTENAEEIEERWIRIYFRLLEPAGISQKCNKMIQRHFLMG